MIFSDKKTKIINSYKDTINFVAKKFEIIAYILYQKAQRIRNSNSNTIRTISADLAQSGDKAQKAILNRAQTYSSSVSIDYSNFKQIVELYFVVKQLIIFYETKVNSLPTQVFNELRNSLDHFVRSLILLDDLGHPSQDESRRTAYMKSQLSKMEGHLQRALFDIAKLGCGKIDEKITEDHKKLGTLAIARANNGEYAIDIFSLLDNAERSLIDARNEESKVGGENDLLVRNKFIEAFSAYVVAYDYHKKNLAKLYWSRSTLYVYTVYGLILSILIKITYDAFSYTPYFRVLVTYLARKLMALSN
ncbi:MAG: hypothetical protein WA151_18850 [Desulfatirhabdiaceae bacterium]